MWKSSCTFLLLIICVSGCTGSQDKDTIRFIDVTSLAGLSGFKHTSGASGDMWFPETMGAGVGFIDYDGDGWEDILLVGGNWWEGGESRAQPAVYLFKNNQDGTFAEVTTEVGLGGVQAYGFGVAVADPDNDGDQDIFLSTLNANLFFRNDQGMFNEVGKEIGLSDMDAWSTAAAFFDADQDGWLDVLVGQYVEWSPETDQWCTIDTVNKEYCTPELYEGLPLRYYHNLGDGTFQEQSSRAGFDVQTGKTLGIALVDVNRDSKMDVVVANDTERDLLFLNDGEGMFTERGLQSGIALSSTGKATAGMGVDTGVIDSTNQAVLMIGNFSKETLGVFQYSASGLFRDKSAASQLGTPSFLSNTFGLFLFDVDLDADQDVFVYNGHVHEKVAEVQEGISHAQYPQLFLNDGRGQFEEVDAKSAGIDERMVGRGAAYADYDRDGDLDVLLLENNGPARLWRNDNETGHAVQIKLVVPASGRSAIGARVEINHGFKKQIQWVKSGSSYLSASSQILTFGLGNDLKIDSLSVFWPDGLVETFTDIPAQQRVVLSQGQREIKTQYQFEGTSSR